MIDMSINSCYKEVLTKLEREEKIIADPPLDKRPKRHGQPTFGNKVKVTFPPLSSVE